MKELETQLTKAKMELDAERRVVAEQKKTLKREFVTKRNLEVNESALTVHCLQPYFRNCSYDN